MRIQEVPTGKIVNITTGDYNCSGCGAAARDVTYDAQATSDFATIGMTCRRRFIFIGLPPVCRCANDIWLNCDDDANPYESPSLEAVADDRRE